MSRRLLISLLVLALLFGCNRKSTNDDESAEPSAAAHAPALPALELRDETPNLLLTWVDEKGDFHVVQKPSEVPEANRNPVRVVVTDREDGTGKAVYVADLTKKNADGTYSVRTMARSEWDELGASRRKARLEALAPSAEPPASAGPAASARASKGSKTRITAIIYGASWCKPCHDAARYLRERGVTVVEKDIEKSELDATEMRAKLAKAQMPPSASIPIIDVAGQMLVGFSPSALERAITTAQSAQPL